MKKGGKKTTPHTNRAELTTTPYFKNFLPHISPSQEKSSHHCTNLTAQCKQCCSPADHTLMVAISTNRNNTVNLSSYARISGIYDVPVYSKAF